FQSVENGTVTSGFSGLGSKIGPRIKEGNLQLQQYGMTVLIPGIMYDLLKKQKSVDLQEEKDAGFHAFTGCDSTSTFVWKDRLQPLRILRSESMFLNRHQNEHRIFWLYVTFRRQEN
ncbi:unnamed protein product, partial [Owenia fusiformis]